MADEAKRYTRLRLVMSKVMESSTSDLKVGREDTAPYPPPPTTPPHPSGRR